MMYTFRKKNSQCKVIMIKKELLPFQNKEFLNINNPANEKKIVIQSNNCFILTLLIRYIPLHHVKDMYSGNIKWSTY